MPRDLRKVFDSMVEEMCSLASEHALLDSCMSLNPEAVRHVPLRYRIIALGFVSGYTLDQLNAKLNAEGCLRLYSRSFWEATLIFAFLHGYSYSQWRELQAGFEDLSKTVGDSEWFQDARITWQDLERYVSGNSGPGGEQWVTGMQTRVLENELRDTADDPSALREFLTRNIRTFSTVREKTRYYFCKYLLYYLNSKIDRYLTACREGSGVEEALSDLLCLKAVTRLRRNPKMPEEEKLALLHGSAISCGELFDSFNYFFFGYVSLDWAEALVECYDRAEDIPEQHRKRLAEAFRKGRNDLNGLKDEEVIRRIVREEEQREDETYASDGSRGYGRNREGENTLHRFLKGTRDIDRSALLCFLLFFHSGGGVPEAHRLTTERLQEILRQCGFPALDTENDFDWFVTEFLESRRPMDFLMEVVNEYTRRYENSFLYHVYSHAVLNGEELEKVMLSD